ncbi:hypothetical protein [Streptomyces caatingaensis]|uniref:Type III effector protein n=1 Tax=Streptomyces caatingaensis TaxID=1678637 RepID=A0A0K9XMX0_9ACTN|nr:hypothetical protein [Streptomyces caatingaensis]KNB54042.1 hypothetical protein AC230_05705 [Streptomyces caatingaensis]
MPERQQPGTAPGAASFPAAEAALAAIKEALHAGRQHDDGAGSAQALAALSLLRQLRDQLAGWETGLIETAREAGASWADLAHPLGVASRQAAERRYLRLRPGAPGTTGEQRVRATRDRRAAERAVTAWARDNAADLRRLAGQLSALADLPPDTRAALVRALGHDNATILIEPLADARPHLSGHHSELAGRIDAVTGHTDRLRGAGDSPRPDGT